MNNVRTVNDFNSEYLYHCWLDEIKESNRPQKGSGIKNVIFYGLLAALVVLSFVFSDNKEPGKFFGPFGYQVVLTGSMERVYPAGSLIVSWAVKPGEELKAGLEDGTDIVFVKEGGEMVVHRIIEIFENYEDSGQRAFRTQGIENPAPDSWTTYEGHVAGRVIWHVPYAGAFLALIADNIFWVLGIIVLFTILITLFQYAFGKEKSQE